MGSEMCIRDRTVSTRENLFSINVVRPAAASEEHAIHHADELADNSLIHADGNEQWDPTPCGERLQAKSTQRATLSWASSARYKKRKINGSIAAVERRA